MRAIRQAGLLFVVGVLVAPSARAADIDPAVHYRLSNVTSGDEMLAVAANHDQVTLIGAQDATQLWTLTPVGEDRYRLTNVAAGEGRSLGVPRKKAEKNANVRVRMFETAQDPRQHWRLERAPDGSYRVLNAAFGSDWSLALGQKKRDRIVMAETGDDLRQRWRLVPHASSSEDVVTVPMDQAPQPTAEQTSVAQEPPVAEQAEATTASSVEPGVIVLDPSILPTRESLNVEPPATQQSEQEPTLAQPDVSTEIQLESEVLTLDSPLVVDVKPSQSDLSASQLQAAQDPDVSGELTLSGSATLSEGTSDIEVRGALELAGLTIIKGADVEDYPWLDALKMIEERARRNAPSSDPNALRAAAFAEFVFAEARKPKSEQELRALEWLDEAMKQHRIEAAEAARAAYYDWQRDPDGYTGQRTTRLMVVMDRLPPPYEEFLAEGARRASSDALAVAEASAPTLWSLMGERKSETSDPDVLAIIDAFVQVASWLKDGFTGWTAGIATAWAGSSERWKQVREASELGPKLDAFVEFARATTPSFTESTYTREGAVQAYIAFLKKTGLPAG